MKKVLFILIVIGVFSFGCSSSSDDYVDPLVEFKTVSQNLSLLFNEQLIVAGLGLESLPDDATDEEKSPYLTAIMIDIPNSQYIIPTCNNIVTFQIMTFVNDIYFNADQDMTINVANDEYVFETEEIRTFEGSLENTSVRFTYNPERETWLFIGKRGGVLNGNPSEEEPKDVWFRQEGAIIDRTTYYVSTILHYEEVDGGTKYTTTSITTYGTSEFPALTMAGEHVSCQASCIDTTYTQIFSDGITSGWEDWDDFKFYPTPGGTIDYEISVD